MFKKKKSGGQPEVSTAALPDIIFMLLFFFMVAAQIKETNLQVNVSLPKGEELDQVDKKKNKIAYINIGRPLPSFESIYGNSSRIQLNDQIAQITDVQKFILTEKSKLVDGEDMIVNLKVDGATTMGIVDDVKKELRKAGQLRINYASDQAE